MSTVEDLRVLQREGFVLADVQSTGGTLRIALRRGRLQVTLDLTREDAAALLHAAP